MSRDNFRRINSSSWINKINRCQRAKFCRVESGSMCGFTSFPPDDVQCGCDFISPRRVDLLFHWIAVQFVKRESGMKRFLIKANVNWAFLWFFVCSCMRCGDWCRVAPIIRKRRWATTSGHHNLCYIVPCGQTSTSGVNNQTPKLARRCTRMFTTRVSWLRWSVVCGCFH